MFVTNFNEFATYTVVNPLKFAADLLESETRKH